MAEVMAEVTDAIGGNVETTRHRVQRPARANEKADKKSKAKTKSKIAAKPKPESKPKAEPASTIPDPAGVVSFLKKLVTPDKNTRRQATEADADPPSHVQPPQ